MSRTSKFPLMMMIAALFLLFSFQKQMVYGFSDQVIQRGATGDDVVELQARLQYIGFYHGKIDGVFGWSTYWAVRNYQEQFGMKVDGLVGPKMKASLERTTQFRKADVEKALRESRKFTHYGGVDPFSKQIGEKGSADTPKQQQQQTQQKQQAGQQQQQTQQKQQAGQQQQQTRQKQQAGQQQQTQQKQQTEQQNKTQQQAGGKQTPQAIAKSEIEQPNRETPKGPQQKDDKKIIEKAVNVPEGFSENDIQLLAQIVYGEARGEPYLGQVAIAAVILNRLNSPIFPNTIAGIIYEPQAFTAVSDGQFYTNPDETARKAALDAINGQDPTGGALYYFNPATATNKWIWSRPQIKKIGKHIFCK